MQYRFIIGGSLMAVAAGLFSAAAYAQDAASARTSSDQAQSSTSAQQPTARPQPGTLEAVDPQEVIVTAQKRVENVQKVPIAVTVISADQLARRGTQSIQDLSQASASLEFTAPAAAPGGGAFVRGIGTNQVGNATSASSVSVVLDGVVLGSANINDIFDTERVEVLKGPQGTLFGSSVSAGVINITTRAPKIGNLSGYLSGELGVKDLGSGYSRQVLRAGVNLPVTTNSALRVAGYYFNNHGITTDIGTGKNSDQANWGVRARYLLDLNDDITVNLIGDYNRSRLNNGGGFIWRAATPGSLIGQALAACGLKVGPRNTDNCAGFNNHGLNQIGGASGQIDWRLGGATLTSITSYRKVSDNAAANVVSLSSDYTRKYLQNCDFVQCSPVVSLTSGTDADPQHSHRSLFTQEMRLASDQNRHLEWVVGAYYQNGTFSVAKPGTLIVHPSFVGADITLAQGTQIAHSSAFDVAAFANLTYYLNDETRLIAGARYTHSRVRERDADPINTHVPTTFFGNTTANALTWRAGIQHDFSPATMVYATVSTGYKAPQLSDALTATNTILRPVKAERPISFEVGVKQTLIANRLYFGADAFYTKARDFQTQSCVGGASGIICDNINVAKLISKGVEFELFGRLARFTNLNVSGIYNDASYPSGFSGADLTDLSGQQANYAPKFKLTVSAEQEVPLTEAYSLIFGGDAAFRTKQSMYLSADPRFIVPKQALVNARVTLRNRDTWSVSLFARNLTNRIYPVQLYPSPFAQGGLWQLLDPNSQRLVGLQFDAHF